MFDVGDSEWTSFVQFVDGLSLGGKNCAGGGHAGGWRFWRSAGDVATSKGWMPISVVASRAAPWLVRREQRAELFAKAALWRGVHPLWSENEYRAFKYKSFVPKVFGSALCESSHFTSPSCPRRAARCIREWPVSF